MLRNKKKYEKKVQRNKGEKTNVNNIGVEWDNNRARE